MSSNQVMTPQFSGAYANFLVDGQTNEDGTLVYSLCGIFDEMDGFDPRDPKSVPNWAKDAVSAAIATGREKKWGGKVPNGLELPFRDGDARDQPEFNGCFYINMKSYKKRCPIVDKNGKALLQVDSDTIYSGAKYRAVIQFAAYDRKGKKGVSAYLVAVQKCGEGERKDGGISESQAENLFGGPASGGAAPEDDSWLN
ncbi:uncharacterized protein DUF2815 [Modicisalibacter xianhensis]|uniref:Uncharacterized protein DUF2815 n=1 Tax=Modicisalibacter xianhensis TaxID=442341 RepID=A0A4R8FD74_9GAMM|nr:ssDNA-binding protein [Halomonas xianhensis]TDX21648.1 uncharacterized protein DUF2815 [Halomonas xianhensis]